MSFIFLSSGHSRTVLTLSEDIWSLRAKNIPEIFYSIRVKLTFVCTSIKFIFLKLLENFTDIFAVLSRIVKIDQNVIEVNDNGNIDHIREDIVYETLKSCRSISKAKRHN